MTEIPEFGQIVRVRQRLWVVGNVTSSQLEGDLLKRQHLITLTSIDDDAFGDDIEVVWELELGTQIIDKAGLPDIAKLDPPEHLDAFLDAVRWGAATNADRLALQSPFRSGVTIEDYQLDPLVRALDMARVNLLIADDVGLGKTIEAGLVIQELLIRHRARTVLIVCPASLLVKWQLEMQEKFGLEFKIVDTDYIRTLRRERGLHANAWTSFPRLIASMDWMKSGEGLRMFKDILPINASYPRKFDVLVVDEAHNVAPSGTGHYAVESLRTKLIRTITPHFEHRLFLSATPHNGYQESFTALLELLDNQRFARGVEPDSHLLQSVMVRRLKKDLVDKAGIALYPERRLLQLLTHYSDQEREVHHWLLEYTKSRMQTVKGTGLEFGITFVLKLLKKRLFSSPMAFATTLTKHLESIRNPKSKNSQIEERILHKAIQKTQEEYANDEDYEEALDEAVQEASAVSVEVTPREHELLEKLSNWANAAKNRVDSKAKAILEWLERHLRPDGVWNDKRVILFTEYRATHTWLKQILATHGFGADRLIELYGSQDPKDRERFKAAFQAHPDVSSVRILLATDAASEGIDLQNYCNYLIHVEIPWNPNVMEQRNGRIDRHGQKQSEVLIWHPVGQSSVSGDNNTPEFYNEYLMRAVRKVDAIRQDLGSVGAVIAQQIEEAMLGKRVYLDTDDVERKALKTRKYMVFGESIEKRVKFLHDRLIDARDAVYLTPDRIARAVRVAMELENVPALKPMALNGNAAQMVYEVPNTLPTAWARAAVGLAHPHTGKRRPITFDHEIAKGRDDVVLAHLNYALVQKSLRLLRAEVWTPAEKKHLSRVTARMIPESLCLEHQLEVPIVCVKSRLVITGGYRHRLHEEMTMAGGALKSGSFARITTLNLMEELETYAETITNPERFLEILKQRFEQSETAIHNAVNARSRMRLDSVMNNLEKRKLLEISNIQKILDDLEQTIRQELNQPEPAQLLLWPEIERNQLKRDLEALRARLQRLPDERILEEQAIIARYSEFQDHTFPVAVIFYIPEKLL